jgi:hypothetical protein
MGWVLQAVGWRLVLLKTWTYDRDRRVSVRYQAFFLVNIASVRTSSPRKDMLASGFACMSRGNALAPARRLLSGLCAAPRILRRSLAAPHLSCTPPPAWRTHRCFCLSPATPSQEEFLRMLRTAPAVYRKQNTTSMASLRASSLPLTRFLSAHLLACTPPLYLRIFSRAPPRVSCGAFALRSACTAFVRERRTFIALRLLCVRAAAA